MNYTKLWIALALVIAASFSVLIFFGLEIYRTAPPIPERVVTTEGEVLFTAQDIRDGQNVWQSTGGHQMGSIWGHGSYLAPDWSTDWLHREAEWILNYWSQNELGLASYQDADDVQFAPLQARLKQELRTNTYQDQTKELIVSPLRAQAIAAVSKHYAELFGGDPSKAELRESYALQTHVIKDADRQSKMNAFFFWTAWACATNRPDSSITFTQNWPHEPLIDNRPTGSIIVWSVISFVVLLAGIGALAWYNAILKHHPDDFVSLPDRDPLLGLNPTPSMLATLKYFWVVVLLIVVQVIMGAVTAHYGVEGSGFYGIPLAEYLPYAVTRTWHTQLAIFWIATAWLATGLFIAPAVSGYEPKFQRAGVNFLFVCLLLIVGGTLFGTWYGTRQEMGLTANFWFGHQGYEYVDLGRFWQTFLFIGLIVWLGLMGRALLPALKQPGANRHLLVLFFISSLAIALFYGAGFMWGRQTHLAIAEYWRWWVIHLWVEGFFEVFATVVIAFLFTRMGLLRVATATSAVLISCIIFLSGGIIGTFHHLYFTGTPTAVLALGATFSALEVVPLVLVGFEAYENLELSRAKQWVKAYKWPIYCFIAVAFWNLVGAGLFGFLINPPIALYYMQGLNTTAVHGHTALFGVYGMLGIGLTLFCLKGMATRYMWNTKTLAFAFWSVNTGLALMVLLSDLPRGLMQTWASVEVGMWYARSADFLDTPTMDTFRWLRVIGDSIFAVGILALGWFVVGLKTGWSLQKTSEKNHNHTG